MRMRGREQALLVPKLGFTFNSPGPFFVSSRISYSSKSTSSSHLPRHQRVHLLDGSLSLLPFFGKNFLIVCFVCLATEIQIHIHIQRSFPRPPSEWWTLKLAQITPCRKVEVLNTKWIIILGCRLCILSSSCTIQLKKENISSGIPYRLLQVVSQFGMWSLEWFQRSTWYVVTSRVCPFIGSEPSLCTCESTWLLTPTLPLELEENRKEQGCLASWGFWKQSNCRCSLSSASYLFAVMGVDF